MKKILYILKKCWLPHTYRTIFDNGNHEYEECLRCGHRRVIVHTLGKTPPNYNWVNHETDTI